MAAGDPYVVLGIPRSASLEDVRAAYRKAVLKWHPDVCAGDRVEGAKKLREATEAYERLIASLKGSERRFHNVVTPEEIARAAFAEMESVETVRKPVSARKRRPHHGGFILVLGVIGLLGSLCCFGFPFALAAWLIGDAHLRNTPAGIMTPAEREMTLAGKVCGMIGVVVTCVVIFVLIVFELVRGTPY